MPIMLKIVEILIILSLFTRVAHPSTSIYGSAFDYKNAFPSTRYFPGKTHEQVAAYCRQELLGTMELFSCAQFDYERAVDRLIGRIHVIEEVLKADDIEHEKNGEPAALPYFRRSQTHWELYRDNNCYSDTYSVGQASLHFVYFWDCMTRMTEARLDELTNPDGND